MSVLQQPWKLMIDQWAGNRGWCDPLLRAMRQDHDYDRLPRAQAREFPGHARWSLSSPSEWFADDTHGVLPISKRYDLARSFTPNVIRVLLGHHIAYHLSELNSLRRLKSVPVLLNGHSQEPLATIKERCFLSGIITIHFARSHWQTPVNIYFERLDEYGY